MNYLDSSYSENVLFHKTYTVLDINVDIGPRGAQDDFNMNNNKIY